jgi:hypothetical protein
MMVALAASLGCSSRSTEAISPIPSTDTFAGTWRSVTPSLEFIRLSIASTSSETGMLATRLTFSGVMWDGQGRIDGDSLVSPMTRVGATEPGAVLVARSREGDTLSVEMRAPAPTPLALTLVRER